MPDYQCSSCGRTFAEESALKAHGVDHRQENFQCAACAEAFKSEEALHAHAVSYHKDFK